MPNLSNVRELSCGPVSQRISESEVYGCPRHAVGGPRGRRSGPPTACLCLLELDYLSKRPQRRVTRWRLLHHKLYTLYRTCTDPHGVAVTLATLREASTPCDARRLPWAATTRILVHLARNVGLWVGGTPPSSSFTFHKESTSVLSMAAPNRPIGGRGSAETALHRYVWGCYSQAYCLIGPKCEPQSEDYFFIMWSSFQEKSPRGVFMAAPNRSLGAAWLQKWPHRSMFGGASAS